MEYLLTVLAGILIGAVGMRLWANRPPQPQAQTDAATPPDPVQSEASAKPAGQLRALRWAALGLGALAAAILVYRAVQPEDVAPTATALTDPAGPAARPGAAVGDVDSMITHLADRLKANPNDGEGFRMLGWSYMMTGHPQQAIEPYKRALALIPDKAAVHEGYGEALVGVAGGKVTDEARGAFQRAIALDPKEPRARYFLALAQAQHGAEKPALDTLVALSNEGPADAPWQTDVRHQITTLSAKLGVDVSSRLKFAGPAAAPVPAGGPAGAVPPLDPAAIAAGQAMPEASRQQMISDMVDRLARRLDANPADPDGWISLLRSRMVMKQPDKAEADLARAKSALTGADRDRVVAAARGLGVPGAQ